MDIAEQPLIAPCNVWNFNNGQPKWGLLFKIQAMLSIQVCKFSALCQKQLHISSTSFIDSVNHTEIFRWHVSEEYYYL